MVYMHTNTLSVFLCIPDSKESVLFLEEASKIQLPLIILTKKKWFHHFEFKNILGIVYFEDHDNYSEIFKKTLQFLQNYNPKIKIFDVLAFGEAQVELMAYLNTQFSTDGLKIQQSLLFRDKYVMKKKAAELSIPTPFFACCSNVDERTEFYKKTIASCQRKNVPFAVLIKPKKSWACQGMKKATSIEIAEEHIATLPNPQDFMIEEYLYADMYHISGLHSQKEIVLTAVVKHLNSAFESGRSVSEHSILHTIDQKGEIARMLQYYHNIISKEFGIINGLTFIEFFYEKQTKKIYFCEAAARHIALFIPTIYEISTGYHILRSFAHICKKRLYSQEPLLLPLKEDLPYAGVIIFAALPGKLTQIDSLDKFQDPEIVLKREIPNILGKEFPHISFANMIGQIFVKTNSENHCVNLLCSYAKNFSYQVSPIASQQ